MPEATFLRCIQEGTNYEIGLSRGRFLREDPQMTAGMREFIDQTPALSAADVAERRRLLEAHCPGQWEELCGLADGLEVAAEDNVFLRHYLLPRAGGCSHVAVLTERTENSHLLLARSYEYYLDDEMAYTVTRVPGRHRHAGFSLFQAGRFDGMNETGFTVTMSSCAVACSSDKEGARGLSFAAVLRALLDTCATVEEAQARLAEMPVGDAFQIMLADATGEAAVYEFGYAGGRPLRAVRHPVDGLLGAFNHYQSAEIAAVHSRRLYFSRVRELAVKSFADARGKVSLSDLKTLVSAPMPEGLNCHAYGDGFGTLHALLCDVTEKRMLCCMGSPRRNAWFEADLSAPPVLERVSVPYENEPIDPSYWNAC